MFGNPFSRDIYRAETKEEKASIGGIIACIGEKDSFTGEELEDLGRLQSEKVDYYGTEKKWKRSGYKNGGEYSYVISALSESNKASTEYYNCTGVAAVGRDRRTGKNLSILSHQDPRFFLNKKENFAKDLVTSLEEMVERSEPGSIDVVIFGGNYTAESQSVLDEHESERTKVHDYRDSIAILSQIINDVVGMDPQVILGPDTSFNVDGTGVVLDTQKRRLYVTRPNQPGQGNTNINFRAADLKSHEERWLS